MADHSFDIYVVEIEFKEERTMRDEFGWVEGHEPGHGRFSTAVETKRVRAPNENYVEAWVKHYYNSSLLKDVVIKNIKKEHVRIDAWISVSAK